MTTYRKIPGFTLSHVTRFAKNTFPVSLFKLYSCSSSIKKAVSGGLSEGVILISNDGIFSQVWRLIDLSDMRGRQTRESCRATDDLRLCVEAAGVAILAELVA